MDLKLGSVLYVRRSILIKAPSDRVWREFADFARLKSWWGVITGDAEAGEATGQYLVAYEPRLGGRMEMAVNWDGARVRFGGTIRTFEPARELTFENDWIPNQGWKKPTAITLRLTPALGGTLVELFHHGFEYSADDPSEDHAAYEKGWGMLQLSTLKSIVEG